MKKLSTLLVLLCAVCMSSCLKNDYELPPTAPGIDIYQRATVQNQYVALLTDYAYKLNVILTELKNNPDYTSIEDLEITVGENKVKAIKLLFGDLNVKITEDKSLPGLWKMKFTDNYMTNYKGVLEIHTEGKLLDAMGNWTIKTNTEDPLRIGMVGIECSALTISNTGTPNSWDIRTSSFGVFDAAQNNKEYMSKWNVRLKVTQSSGDQTYKGMQEASYEVSGDANGIPTGFSSDFNFTYDISWESPLKYKYCENAKRHVMYRGQEIVTADHLAMVNPESYPASKVTVTWNELQTCNIIYLVSYNGQTSSNDPSGGGK